MTNLMTIAHRVAELSQPLSDRRDYGSGSYAKARAIEWSNSVPGQKLLNQIVGLQDLAGLDSYNDELSYLPEILEDVIVQSQAVLEFLKD